MTSTGSESSAQISRAGSCTVTVLAWMALLPIAITQLPASHSPSHVRGAIPAASATVHENTVTDLDEAIQRAIRHSPTITALQAATHVAQERVRAIGDFRDPELRYTISDGADTDIDGEEDSTGYRIGMRFFPPNLWLRASGKTREAALYRAACADLQSAMWDLSATVAQLVCDFQHVNADILLLEELVTNYETTLGLVRKRSQTGQSAGQEIVSAARRYLGAVSDRDRALHRRQQLRHELASLIGVRTDAIAFPPMVEEIDEPVLPHDDTDLAAAEVTATRPDLAAMHWRARAAKAAYKETRSAQLPWLQHIQISYAEDQQEAFLMDQESEEWRVDVAVSIPLFSWLNHTPSLRREEFELALGAKQAAVRAARIDVQNAIDTVRESRDQIATYHQTTTPVIAEVETILTQLTQQTAFAPLEAARVAEELLEHKRLRLNAIYEYRSAVIRLQKMMGTIHNREEIPCNDK